MFRVRARHLVGTPLHRSSTGRWARGLSTLVVVLVAAVALAGGAPAWSAPILGVTLACTWLMPRETEFVCGEGGLCVGWWLVGWPDLEEWRLSGEHLRFRLRGTWRSIPLPASLHAQVRALLERQAPGAQSRFER